MPVDDSPAANSTGAPRDDRDTGDDQARSGASESGRDEVATSRSRQRGQAFLRVLTVVLAIEALAVAAGIVLLVVEQIVSPTATQMMSIALIVLMVIALGIVIAIAVGAVRRAPWVPSAAITWQILQFAAAWALLQGDLALLLGWSLTVLSFVGIVCSVHPATRSVLRPRDR